MPSCARRCAASRGSALILRMAAMARCRASKERSGSFRWPSRPSPPSGGSSPRSGSSRSAAGASLRPSSGAPPTTSPFGRPSMSRSPPARRPITALGPPWNLSRRRGHREPAVEGRGILRRCPRRGRRRRGARGQRGLLLRGLLQRPGRDLTGGQPLLSQAPNPRPSQCQQSSLPGPLGEGTRRRPPLWPDPAALPWDEAARRLLGAMVESDLLAAKRAAYHRAGRFLPDAVAALRQEAADATEDLVARLRRRRSSPDAA